MDELILRCNSLKCREQLIERAIVTTCSHIFCENCAHNLGLSAPAAGPRLCPACATQLNNPDDAVVAVLHPPDDYKTSVLSGLSPSAIMECAARGIAFWTYQATQEVKYQSYLGHSLTERYQSLNDHVDRIVNEANNEIKKFQDRMDVLNEEQAQLVRMNNELQTAYKEKSKAFANLRKLYHAAKVKEMAIQVQGAAEDDADHALLTAAANRFKDRSGPKVVTTGSPSFSHFNFDRQATDRIRGQPQSEGMSTAVGRGNHYGREAHTLNHFGTAPMQTPSALRSQLPVPQRTGIGNVTPLARQPLKPLNLNTKSGNVSHVGAPRFNKPVGRQTPLLSRLNTNLPSTLR